MIGSRHAGATCGRGLRAIVDEIYGKLGNHDFHHSHASHHSHWLYFSSKQPPQGCHEID